MAQKMIYSTGSLYASKRKPTKKDIERIAKEIIRLRKEKVKEEEKPFYDPHKKNNVGFWNGCIIQTYSEAYETFGLSMSEIDVVIKEIGG